MRRTKSQSVELNLTLYLFQCRREAITEKMESELARFGLDTSLAPSNILGGGIGVITAVVTGAFTSRLDTLMPPSRIAEVTLFSVTLVATMFVILHVYVGSWISKSINNYSLNYWRLQMRLIQFMQAFMVTALMHLIARAFLSGWESAQLTVPETISISIMLFTTVYLAIQIMSKSTSES